MNAAPHADRVAPSEAWVGDRGERILALLGIQGPRNPISLADRILLDAGPFRDRLRSGLRMLLGAARDRDRGAAAAAACRLVGVGPGRTPLGDDYLAATGLAIAAFGADAEFREGRTEWLAAALPRGLVAITTPVSAALMRQAFRGIPPEPLAPLLERNVDPITLQHAVLRSRGIGATSGSAWAGAIGATAALLTRPAQQTETNPKETMIE